MTLLTHIRSIRNRKETGFTILEATIAIALLGLFMVMVFNSLETVARASAVLTVKTDVSTSARFVTEYIRSYPEVQTFNVATEGCGEVVSMEHLNLSVSSNLCVRVTGTPDNWSVVGTRNIGNKPFTYIYNS